MQHLSRLVFALSLTSTLFACETTGKTESSAESQNVTSVPNLVLTDQPGGDSVIITAFTLDQPGYVVVHKDNDGKPGPVIGVSELIQPGVYRNYRVDIDANEAGAAVFPMLHYDNGDGKYEFPGPDGPVTVASKVLVGKVTWQ